MQEEKKLEGKKIILGITGGIAAYKSADLVSKLRQQGADVHVLMSKSAKKFIGKTTLAALSGNLVLDSVFSKNSSFNHLKHILDADLFVIAPATANTIARISLGLAERIIETACLAAGCPKLVCPAMNSNMWLADQTQGHIENLKTLGFNVLEPESGFLACGMQGVGRLPDVSRILAEINEVLSNDVSFEDFMRSKSSIGYPFKSSVPSLSTESIGLDSGAAAALSSQNSFINNSTNSSLKGKNILITCGPTREYLDDVRYISNKSSGRMGYELACAAKSMGANVTVISGPCKYFDETNSVQVESADQMLAEVKKGFDYQDIVICAAAVCDFRFEKIDGKIKKSDFVTNNYLGNIGYTQDILAWCGEFKRIGQIIVGFALESENLAINALNKLQNKNIDVILANKVSDLGSDLISPLIINRNQKKLFQADSISKKTAAVELMNVVGQEIFS
ncbi:bifunctional phosphopantothenoylcysteine decarboxylase/phosphopantothenate synthase [Patescibacteria group bacterium]|nr:bifunctional phosphopantothenoylcysteine decarboxylase/phosphopantothenate synthase [Patescibacteria group bacterium]